MRSTPEHPPPHPARGWALGVCVIVWGLMTAGVAAGVGGSNPAAFHTTFPTWIGILVWGAPTLMAAYTWATRRGAAYTVAALILGPILRVTSYAWAWVVWLLEPGDVGSQAGWYLAGLHLAMVGIVVVAALLTREDRTVRGEA